MFLKACRTRHLSVGVLTLLCVACSPSPFDADVSGAITLDGKPVDPGVVVFSPVDPGKNASRGNIDRSGGYYMKTKHDRGIDAGEYRVAVQVYDKGEPPGPGERASPNLPPLVPEKYLKVETSGLEYTVEPGSNRIDIALTSE